MRSARQGQHSVSSFVFREWLKRRRRRLREKEQAHFDNHLWPDRAIRGWQNARAPHGATAAGPDLSLRLFPPEALREIGGRRRALPFPRQAVDSVAQGLRSFP